MVRRYLAALTIAVPLLAGACSEQSTPSPNAPQEGPSLATAAAPSCSFTTINSLIRSEFLNETVQGTALGRLTVMTQSGQYTPGAVAAGFDIMALISTAKKQNFARDAATGSNLTNQLIACMFNPASGPEFFPASFPVDFTRALDRNQPGGYEVRGPTADANPVLSFPTAADPRLSGLAPAAGNWNGVLTETTLIYGNPIPTGIGSGYDPTQYEWSTIRPGTAFNYPPGVLVALCEIPSLGPTDVMEESNVGLLGYVASPSICGAAFALERGWRPFEMLAQLRSFGTRWLAPQPLSATSMMAITNIGGVGGGKSIYSLKHVDNSTPSTFQFVTQPTDTRVGVPINPSVTVQATYQGVGVGGVTITLIGVVNNGTPTQIFCPASPCQAVTAPGGIAVFNPLTITKSGALSLVITNAEMGGRTLAFQTGISSVKFNVRPAK